VIRTGLGLLLLWVIAALLVRGVVGDLLTVFGVRPDLLTIVLVYFALAAGPVSGTLAGFLVGLVADADAGRALGLQAGLMSVLGCLVGHAGHQLIRENPFLQAGLVGVAALVVGTGRAAALLSGQGGDALAHAFPLILGGALYSAIFAPIFYWVAHRLGLPDLLARVSSEE
jgi:rod shape-determining protein MreD